MSYGMTLIELVAALVVLTIVAGLGAPSVNRLRDRIALDAAVADMRVALSETRARSIGRGASLVLRLDPPSAAVVVGGRIERTIPLGASGRSVGVHVSGAVPRTIRFDALGIGRFASTSIDFPLGGMRRRVVVSSWGRVRVE